AFSFLFERLGVDYSRIERGPWSGDVTPVSALVKAKLVEEGLEARLLVSSDSKLKSPLYFGPRRAETNHHNLLEFPLTGLKPNTQYYYALEVSGRVDKRNQGAFR